MNTPETPPLGLRERKKQETRQALSWAALRLAVERGLSNVLVEDIAAAADVSPRTFNNYFSSKAEAIAFRHLDRFRQAAVLLRARPADEPLWEAVSKAALTQFGGTNESPPDPDWVAGVRLMMSDPALQGETLRAATLAEAEFAEAVAERIGSSAAGDLYPRLVAAAVGSAVQVSTDLWFKSDPPRSLGPLLQEALTLISAGLPVPD